MRHPRLPLLVLLAACGPASFETDNGQLAISDETVIDLVADDGGPSPFLAATGLCPDLSLVGDAYPSGDYDPLACFAQSFEGPVTVAGECLAFDAPGVVDWTFTAQACPGNEFGYAPTDDHVAIEVVAAADVEGRLAMPYEELAESLEDQEGWTVTRPDDWRVADGATWRIVEGQAFDLAPRLRTLADGIAVAWKDGTLVSTGGTTVAAQESVGTFRVAPAYGETADLSLDVGRSNIPIGQVAGAPLSAVASVEIALVQMGGAETGVSVPVGARAVVRDRDGELLLGAPVDWHFSPMLVLPGPASGLPGADYVAFSDQCRDPEKTFGEQRARLRASVGGVSDSVEVVWTPRLEGAPQEGGWAAAEDCEAACGCASGGSTPGAVAVLLGLVAFVRRRARV